jgi:ribonucleoside-diphosphate reductase alpha chain
MTFPMLPRVRPAITTSFALGPAEGTLTVGMYPDGRPGEIALRMDKQGSTLAGMLDSISVATSLALQGGVPVAEIASEYRGCRFEPAGRTDDPEIPVATSVVDYVARRLEADFS